MPSSKKLAGYRDWRARLEREWIDSRWTNRGCTRITEREVIQRIGATVMRWTEPSRYQEEAQQAFDDLRRGTGCQSVRASSPTGEYIEVCYDKRNKSFWLCPW